MNARNARRSIGLTVVSGLAVALTLTACSGTSTEGGELSILTGWSAGSPELVILEDLAAEFEAEHGVEVSITPVAEGLADAHETAVLSGSEDDIIITNLAEKAYNWLDNGAAVAANSYLEEWGIADRVLPQALAEWTDDAGDVRGLPYWGYVWPVWYNTELLEAAGIDEVPQTTDELIDAAEALNAAGTAPITIGGSDWSGQKLFLQFAQSYLPTEDAQRVFAEGGWCVSDDAMRGIDLFVELRDAGVFIEDAEGYTAETMNAAFFERQAAVFSAGSWSFSQVPDDLMPAVELGGLPIPTDGVFEHPTVLSGWAGGFFISPRGAENIDVVKEFLLQFYETDVMQRFVKEVSIPLAVTSDAELEAGNPLLASWVNDLPGTTDFAVMPDMFVPGELGDALIRQTALAYVPGTDSATICAGLDSVYP